MGGVDLALFQMSGTQICGALVLPGEQDNDELLSKALAALATGDYFMTSFYRRTQAAEIGDLPSI